MALSVFVVSQQRACLLGEQSGFLTHNEVTRVIFHVLSTTSLPLVRTVACVILLFALEELLMNSIQRSFTASVAPRSRFL